MEIVYKQCKIRARRGLSDWYQDFYVQAEGFFDGIHVYFGSYDAGKVDTTVEGSTLVRCGYPPKQNFKSKEEAVEWLCRELDRQIQRAGVSMHEVIGHFNRTMKPWPKDFVQPWQINLLIGS